MHYYIDGYNLLFVAMQEPLPAFRSKEPRDLLEKKRNQLIQALLAFPKSITVVFDGQGRLLDRSHKEQLEIIYTPFDQSADQWLISQMTWLGNKKKKTTSDQHHVALVSSDRLLQQRCKHQRGRKGLTILTSDQFWQLLNEKTASLDTFKKASLYAPHPKNDLSISSSYEIEAKQWVTLFYEPSTR